MTVAAALAVSCSVFKKAYEYEEELWLSIDGSATVDVNASVAALVALRGADLSLDPAVRPDREQVRAIFSGPEVEVGRPTFFTRGGRRFIHVRVEVDDIRRLERLAPFAWSSYRFERSGEGFVFRVKRLFEVVVGSTLETEAAVDAFQGVAVVEAAFDDLHPVPPWHPGDLGRGAYQYLDRVSGLEELRDQPPADVAGGPGDEHGSAGAVHLDLLGTSHCGMRGCQASLAIRAGGLAGTFVQRLSQVFPKGFRRCLEGSVGPPNRVLECR